MSALASSGFRSVLLRPFGPVMETVRHYSAFKFRRDLVAGMTVSVVEVPQAMAYALIAGVPPEYGLYTSIIQGVIGALLSSSEHMTTGPTNTQSLLIASAATRALGPAASPAVYLQIVFALAMLKGIIQLFFAALRLGNIVRYVSRSVIVGIAAGAGVLIAVGQLPHLLGITGHATGHHYPGVISPLMTLGQHVRDVNYRALLVGLGCIAVVLVGRRISRFFPGALLAVVCSAVLVGVMHWSSGQLPLIGELPRGWVHFEVPNVSASQMQAIAGGALALALLGMLESVAIAKSIAAKTNERIDANQEFFAQGLKNFVTSFFQCIPGSGSFSRSALDYMAGAQTRFAAVFNALFVAIIYFSLADQAQYIPMTALAAVLLVIAYGLVDIQYFKRVWRATPADAAVCLVTFLATLFAPLEYAVFIGIALNVLLYVRTASRLHMSEFSVGAESNVQEMPGGEVTTNRADSDIVMLQLEGDLFFGVANDLEERLWQVLNKKDVHAVILRLRRAYSIDDSALNVLEQFVMLARGRSIHVIFCGVNASVYDRMANRGLVAQMGADNVLMVRQGMFEGARFAIARARQLIDVKKPTKSREEALDFQI